MQHTHRRFSPSTLIATLALIAATGGTALAAGNNDAGVPAKTKAKASALAAGCAPGNVNGFARIRGLAGIGSVYTSSTAAIDNTHNCAGGTVLVRRSDTGKYFVRFAGNQSSLAIVSANEDGASSAFSGDADNIVTVGKITSGADAGAFRIDVQDADNSTPTGTKPQNGQFTIALL